jgi:hypothetical protein
MGFGRNFTAAQATHLAICKCFVTGYGWRRSLKKRRTQMFEPKTDPQLEQLKTQLAEMITLERALLKKLEEQMVILNSIGRFVKENSAGTAAFARTR